MGDAAADADATLTIKTSSGTKYTIKCALTSTVLGLKEHVALIASVPVEDQKLIFSGRILKNEEPLTKYGVKDGTSLHLVKSKKKEAAGPASSTAGDNASATQASNTGASFNAGVNPFASLGGMGGMGHNMPSREEMSRMMDNPMVQSMLNSPEVMEAMLMSNPQMREIVEQNPELGRAMRDPAILRQAMEMQRNPAMMRESMRAHDRAMSNVESMPGGFNQLRQMYTNVQEPLERAADSMRQQEPSSTQAGSGGSSTGSRTQANPFASLFANANADANTNANSSAEGGTSSLFSNPVVVESMREAMSNPEVLQQMASLNPYMNAEALRNPANLEAMMKMQESMAQLERAGITSQLAGMGTGTEAIQSMMGRVMSNPEAMQAMMRPENMRALAQMQESMTALLQAGLMPSADEAQAHMAGLGGANAQAHMAGLGGANAQAGVRERYSKEIAEVQAMGFSDDAAIIQALVVCEGNVQNAINFLLG